MYDEVNMFVYIVYTYIYIEIDSGIHDDTYMIYIIIYGIWECLKMVNYAQKLSIEWKPENSY